MWRLLYSGEAVKYQVNRAADSEVRLKISAARPTGRKPVCTTGCRVIYRLGALVVRNAYEAGNLKS
jgi:hypothetical protein